MNNIIKITDEWIKNAGDFAEQSISTNIGMYAARNQPNIKKGTNDNKIGKIGEEVVYTYLKDNIPRYYNT